MDYCNGIDGFRKNGVGFVITVNELCYYTFAEGLLPMIEETLFLFRNADSGIGTGPVFSSPTSYSLMFQCYSTGNLEDDEIVDASVLRRLSVCMWS